MKILLFAGSLRKASLNKKLLKIEEQILKDLGCETVVLDLQALNFPVYDGDIEAMGIPESVKTLGKHISQADAVVIASPEYNSSIAGSLKNAIDWVSRLRPVPFEKKPILLTGASPGLYGSVRGLLFTRAPFETLGAYVYPTTFALSKAGEAFTDEGELKDEATKKRLADLLAAFKPFAEKLSK